ncbi:MAG: aspartate kinase, partial [Duncaniella sp.]|nr:aspartate kinase [Duncaniella sp.]
MKVLKFGGTSVGSAERIRHVASLVAPRGRNIIVLSAMSGTTNTLVEIAGYLYKRNTNGAKETINLLESKYLKTIAQLYDRHESREKALKEIKGYFSYLRSFTRLASFSSVEEKMILAQGEMMSVAMMTILLQERGINAEALPALDYMKTGENSEPDMNHIQANLQALLDSRPDADIYLTQGYICRNIDGEVDNLQRGGSDYTASLIGAAIEAEEIEIWTDIDGMHNNDPRFVDNTKPVGELHYEEAAELAYFGAKILHPTCVLPAKTDNIPVRLLNTMEPEAKGTLIYNRIAEPCIKAVAAKDNVTAIKIK